MNEQIPKSENGRVQITIRVDRELLAKFDQAWKGVFTSRNDAIIQAMINYIPKLIEQKKLWKEAEDWLRRIANKKVR